GGECTTDAGRVYDTGRVSVISQAIFRNATSGEKLPEDRTAIDKSAAAVFGRFHQAPPDAETLGRLYTDVQLTNYDGFRADLGDRKVAYEALWTALSTVVSMSEFATVVMDLPIGQSDAIDALDRADLRQESQPLVLVQGDKQSSVTISGFTHT